MLYIRCFQLLTPSRLIQDAAILVDGSRILVCGPAAVVDKPPGSQVLEAAGLTAVPGYVDWQLNGGFGYDFTDTPTSIWDVGARLPEHGVTSFLPTIITSPAQTYSSAQRVLQAGPPQGYKGAQALGLHFEGPFLNPVKKGAHNPAYLRLATQAEIKDWSRRKHVWLVTLAPELPGASEAVQTLRKRGVVVSAGHSMATCEQGLAAFELGVGAGTHLFNAMPFFDHRAPGLTAALLTSDKTIVGLIPDGIHVNPVMVSIAWKQKGPSRVAIVTDAMAALGMPPGEYSLGGYRVIVDEVSARLADGTLAGSILRMDQAVRNLLTFTGCSLREAVDSATLNPARLVGSRHKGRLSPGADADIVLLDSSARVAATIVRGEILYNNL